MRHRSRSLLPAAVALAVVALSTSGCLVRFTAIDVKDVPVPTSRPVLYRTPTKVHLRDGSTIVYAKGASVSARDIVGNGMRYAAGADSGVAVTGVVSMDSVTAMESYRQRVRDVPSGIVTGVATTAVALVVLEFVLSRLVFGLSFNTR